MNLLFVCNQGRYRSKTAAELFSDDFSTRYRGLYDNILQRADLEWADSVVAMEEAQRREIGKRFPKEYLQKQIVCWDIPDRFDYNQEELIALLKEKSHMFFTHSFN